VTALPGDKVLDTRIRVRDTWKPVNFPGSGPKFIAPLPGQNASTIECSLEVGKRPAGLCGEVLYESSCELDPIAEFGFFKLTFASVQEIIGKCSPTPVNDRII
jgi:hypothetical protein